MGWFLNLKTGQKLTLAFSLCLTLATIIGVTAVVRMGQMNDIAELLSSHTVVGFEAMQKFTDDSKQYRTFEMRHVIASDEASKRAFEPQMDSLASDVSKDLDDYEKSIDMDEDRSNFDELKRRWQTYLGFHDGLMALSHKNDLKGCSAYIGGDMTKAYEAVRESRSPQSRTGKSGEANSCRPRLVALIQALDSP